MCESRCLPLCLGQDFHVAEFIGPLHDGSERSGELRWHLSQHNFESLQPPHLQQERRPILCQGKPLRWSKTSVDCTYKDLRHLMGGEITQSLAIPSRHCGDLSHHHFSGASIDGEDLSFRHSHGAHRELGSSVVHGDATSTSHTWPPHATGNHCCVTGHTACQLQKKRLLPRSLQIGQSSQVGDYGAFQGLSKSLANKPGLWWSRLPLLRASHGCHQGWSQCEPGSPCRHLCNVARLRRQKRRPGESFTSTTRPTWIKLINSEVPNNA